MLLFTFLVGSLMLNANQYKVVLLTNDMGTGCFTEARRDGCDGLIPQTDNVLEGGKELSLERK